MAARSPSSEYGRVSLVGAGPGDPRLITVAGRAALARADVVVYDYLANPALLTHCRADAELIYVGKKAGAHSVPQNKITALLIKKARAGCAVVRLKGGDPFVFGRGGEEAEELAAAGVPWEIIPGVTSAFAVPAYAGIPVTHRAHTPLVTVVTGHEDPTKATGGASDALAIPWEVIGPGPGTVVFLMGVSRLDENMRSLTAHGRSPDTPAAAIQWGTRAGQRTVVGTVGTLARLVSDAGLRAPSVVVVGTVVRARETLAWFERRPLFGRRILVTRTREQASAFSSLLRDKGAEVLEAPTIEVRPPHRWGPLAKALANTERWHWLIFTSANGVRFAREAVRRTGGDVRALKGVKLCAIGPATAAAVRDWGLAVDCVPEEFQAEGIVEALAAHTRLRGKRILIARAKDARDYLPRALRARGATVRVVTAYDAICPPQSREAIGRILRGEYGRVDMATFTSSSTVTNFVRLAGEAGPAAKSGSLLPPETVVGCIGPITARTAEAAGLTPAVMPEQWTIPAFADAIVEFFEQTPVSDAANN